MIHKENSDWLLPALLSTTEVGERGAKSNGCALGGLFTVHITGNLVDGYAMFQLSWVNLALKRNADAVRFAQQATELLPVEKDAVNGPAFLASLAEIQAHAGESGEAVKTLRRVLSLAAGYYVSLQQLKIDPVWDPIRNDPGFQQLLTGKERIQPNK